MHRYEAIQHTDIFDVIDPGKYAGAIRDVTEKNQRQTRSVFEQFPLAPDACIVVVGSDGKGEKYPCSRTEVALWQRSPVHTSTDLPLWYLNFFGHPYSEHYDSLNEGGCEIKTTCCPEPQSYAYGNKNAVFPDRIINAAYICGSRDVYQEMKMRALQEMTGTTLESRRVRKHIDEQFGSYKQSLHTGTYNGLTVLTMDPPIQYCDCGRFVTGFKMPVLRLTQRFLDKVTIHAIRSGTITLDEAVQIPTNTVERMSFLYEANCVPQPEEAQIAYLWFLKEYHRAQKASQRMGSEIGIRYTTNGYLERVTPLLRWVSETKNFFNHFTPP